MATPILAADLSRAVAVMIVEDEQELEFLITYRQASAAGKRRITKMLHAAVNGLLPSVERISAMTTAERRALADSLPAVRP